MFSTAPSLSWPASISSWTTRRETTGRRNNMSDKVTFLSAQLLSFKRKPEGGSAQFSCSLSRPMCNAMGWADDIPEFVAGGKLDGDLAAHNLYLVPKDK